MTYSISSAQPDYHQPISSFKWSYPILWPKFLVKRFSLKVHKVQCLTVRTDVSQNVIYLGGHPWGFPCFGIHITFSRSFPLVILSCFARSYFQESLFPLQDIANSSLKWRYQAGFQLSTIQSRQHVLKKKMSFKSVTPDSELRRAEEAAKHGFWWIVATWRIMPKHRVPPYVLDQKTWILMDFDPLADYAQT